MRFDELNNIGIISIISPQRLLILNQYGLSGIGPQKRSGNQSILRPQIKLYSVNCSSVIWSSKTTKNEGKKRNILQRPRVRHRLRLNIV